jgi:hypothetical protein
MGLPNWMSAGATDERKVTFELDLFCKMVYVL